VTAIAGCSDTDDTGPSPTPSGGDSTTSGEDSTPDNETETPETTETTPEGTEAEQESYNSYPYNSLTDNQRIFLDVVPTFDGFDDLRGAGTVTITQATEEAGRYFDNPAVWINTGQTVQFRIADSADERAYTVETDPNTTDEFITEDTPPREFSHTFENEGIYMYQNPRWAREGTRGVIVVGRPV